MNLLRSWAKILGLIVGEPQPDRAPDLALLQGLIPHLTIAAKQSLAFSTIRAMNKDLEQRVALRTGELSKAKEIGRAHV